MKLRIYLSGSVLILAAFAIVAFSRSAGAANPDEDKPAAPAFSVTSLDGQKFELAALRGKVVVLNLWGTFCPPCVDEIPQLNGLVEEFKGKDVVFIALAVDDVSTLSTFLKDHPFKYHIVANAATLIMGSYGEGNGFSLPMHLVIDKEGRIDTKLKGKLVTSKGTKQFDTFRSAIARLANAPSGKTE